MVCAHIVTFSKPSKLLICHTFQMHCSNANFTFGWLWFVKLNLLSIAYATIVSWTPKNDGFLLDIFDNFSSLISKFSYILLTEQTFQMKEVMTVPHIALEYHVSTELAWKFLVLLFVTVHLSIAYSHFEAYCTLKTIIFSLTAPT